MCAQCEQHAPTHRFLDQWKRCPTCDALCRKHGIDPDTGRRIGPDTTK